MPERYLEDLRVGQVFRSGRMHVTAEDIKAFASKFDPQPFHMSEETARDSLFGGLAASGWHTAAVTMRLIVDAEFRPAGGHIGARIELLSWPRPVRPGDELRTESVLLEVRPSETKPGYGWIKIRTTTFNQNDEPVQIYVGNLIVKRRPT